MSQDASGGELDRILSSDLGWKPLQLESGRLRLTSQPNRLPACRPFRRTGSSEEVPSKASLDRLIKKHPERPWNFAWRAELKRIKGDLAGARADMDLALARDRDNADLLILSARLGRRRHLERALALSPDSFWGLVHQGWEDLRAGKAAAAARDFSLVLKSHPRCAWAWYWRALSRAEAGDLPGARRDRERAILLDPAAIWSYSSRAKDIGTVTDWPAVFADCEARIKANPKDAVAYALRAECRDQHELVHADHRRAIELDPGRAWFHALSARVLVYKGQADEAMREIEIAIARWPECGWFYSWRGEIHRRQASFKDAIADQSKAIALNGNDSRAYAWRGSLRGMLGDLNQARQDLDRSLELDTEYASWILSERRHVRWSLKDFNGAWEDLRQAARRDPRHSFSKNAEGRKDFSWGLKTLSAILRRDPRCVWAWAWKGEALLRLGWPRRALESLDKALALDRRCALAALWRAEARQALKMYSGAGQDIERCLKDDPWLAWAYALRAQLKARQGRHASAAADLEIFKALSVKDCGASLYRAMLLRRAGRAEDSRKICDRLLLANPDDAWVYQERSLDRLACGDLAGAYRDQRRAQRSDARQPWFFGFPDRPIKTLDNRLSWAIGELPASRGAWKGYLQLLAGRTAEAEKDLRKALRPHKDADWVLGWLGELYLRQDRNGEALAFLKNASARQGKGAVAWIAALWGEALVRQGRLEEARKAFDQAIALDGEDNLARVGRARLFQQEGRLKAALEDLDAALFYEPHSAGLRYRRGEILTSLGRFPEAEAELSQAISLHGEYADAINLREEVRRRLGAVRAVAS